MPDWKRIVRERIAALHLEGPAELDLAEELARNGVAFHRAHQLVGRLVLESVRTGKNPSDWTGEALAAFAPEFQPHMARLLSPLEGMKTRELPGGAGPAAVAQALQQADERLARIRRQISEP